MTKTIDTLVKDVQGLFENGHMINSDAMLASVMRHGDVIAARLEEHGKPRGVGYLRMSNLGKPDRQLWYETHRDATGKEGLNASTKIKFMFGDILENFLLYLAEEAGHTVSDRQRKVEVDGVFGSIDCIIDGVLVDVKSASSISFKKFQDGSLVMDDPFGYIEQLAGYSCALGNIDGGFFVIDKTLGHICLLKIPADELKAIDIRGRIAYAKGIVAQDTPPERCYDPKPDGESGNMILSVGCSYCPFKKECWSDANDGVGLRTFLYSNGPRHFVDVQREPRTMEITF